jgi:gliding motility-associated-like protein
MKLSRYIIFLLLLLNINSYSNGINNVSCTKIFCLSEIKISNAETSNLPSDGYKSLFHFGNDTVLCAGDSIILNAGSGYLSYIWQDGSTDSMFTVKISGVYWCHAATLTDTISDTITVTQIYPPIVNLGPDTSICAGKSITFNAGSGNNIYHWQNGSSDSLFMATTTGIYSVTVTNQCGSDADSVRIINIYPNPQPFLGNDTIICTSSPIHLDAGSGYTAYLWQNSSTGQTFIATAAGTYSVTVTNNHNCQGSDAITISPGQQPTVSLGENRDLCKVQSIILDAGSGFNSYKWQDGSTLQTLTVKTAGTYSVTVTDDCGSARSSVTISECPDCICDIPNAFTPNYDGENDILYVKGKGFTELEYKIYNRLGEQIFISHDIDYGWDGKWFGVIQKSDVYVYVINATCENGKKMFKKGNVTLLR